LVDSSFRKHQERLPSDGRTDNRHFPRDRGIAHAGVRKVACMPEQLLYYRAMSKAASTDHFFWCIRGRCISVAWLACVLLLIACQTPADSSDDVKCPSKTVQSIYSLSVNTTDPALSSAERQPVTTPITLNRQEGNDLAIAAYVKAIPLRPGVLRVELVFSNQGIAPIAAAEVAVSDVATLYHFTDEPLSEPTQERRFSLGALSPGHAETLALGLAKDTPSLTVRVVGSVACAPLPVAHNSAPLLLSGEQLWVAVPDADRVVLLNPVNMSNVGAISVPGRPIALADAGTQLLVASSTGNRVMVVDKVQRTVVQQLGANEELGRELRSIVVQGAAAYVSSYVDGQLTKLRLEQGVWKIVGQLTVARRPHGLSITPDGKTLYAAHYLPRGPITDNEAVVSVVRTESFTLDHEVKLRDPYNLKDVGCLAKSLRVAAEEVSHEGVPTQLAGVFLSPMGTEGWVPHTAIGPQPVWEKGPNATLNDPRIQAQSGTISAGFVKLLTTGKADTSRARLHGGFLDDPDGDLERFSCMQYPDEIYLAINAPSPESPNDRLTAAGAVSAMGNASLSPIGIPTFVAFTPNGQYAFVLSRMGDLVAVYDRHSHHPVSENHFRLSGNNPTGMVFSGDGTRAYVSFANSMMVQVLDTSAYAKSQAALYVPYEVRKVTGASPGLGIFTSRRIVRKIKTPTFELPSVLAIREVGQIGLGNDPMDPVVRRGKMLFESSNPQKYPTLSKHVMGSCVSCHADGGGDGSLWATMEGERRTMSLRGGVSGRGWLHASATHQSAVNFTRYIVQDRLGGKLGIEDLAALSQYLLRHIPRLQPPKTDPVLVKSGQELFTKHCASCHAGSLSTSGEPDQTDPSSGSMSGPVLFDVGSATDSARVLTAPYFISSLFRMAPMLSMLRGDRDLGDMDPIQKQLDFSPRPNRKRGVFKAPALVDVYDSVLYFHDGRFTSLEQVVRHFDERLSLGLTEVERRALVEYLKTR